MAQEIWVEIISVRLCDPENGTAVQDIFDQINPPLAGNNEQGRNAELYLNIKNKTDWSIYLYWQEQAKDTAKTVLGQSIAEAFNALGLVTHSLWMRGGAG